MIYLISEDILKSEGLIDDNLWGGYLKPAITLAQDRGLQSLIGGVLYDKICDLVADNSIKDEENKKYKDLLDDYIIPYLMFQTLAEVGVPITWKFKNQGLVGYNDTNNDWVNRPSMKDFQYIIQKYENDAVFYGNRLTDYLNTHISLFPEYLKYERGKMKADDRQYKTGLYLGRGSRCCGLRCDLPNTNK